MSPTDKLFGKPHLIGAWWQVIVGLLLVLVGYAVAKTDGPAKVFVENADDLRTSEPSIIRSTAELDSEAKEQLRDVATSVRRLMDSQQHRDRQTPPDASRAEIESLRKQVQELTALTREAKSPPLTTSQPSEPRRSPPEALTVRQPVNGVSLMFPAPGADATTSFSRPDTVKGYTLLKPTGEVSGLNCPSPVRKSDSTIAITFSVRDEGTRSKISPMHVSVARVDAPLQQTQLYGAYILTDVGHNAIVLEAKLEPGSYVLTAGYYLLAKLSGEFPPLHAMDCPFEVP